MSEFEGEIEEANNELKQMKYPNKDGTTSWKYGLKVKGEWYGIFGTQEELADIKKDVDAGGNYAKGTYKLSKDGKYRNIEEVKISRNLKGAVEKGETADERAMREELENTRPDKSLVGAKQGKAEPRKEPPVQEERIGVEDQEAEEDQHYIKAWARAGRIADTARGFYPKTFLDVHGIDDDFQFRLALFDKLASPLVYLRENIRKARAEAGVK